MNRGRRVNKWVVLLFCFSINACSTMHFENGPTMEDTVVRERWHHLAVVGLIEISPPLDVEYSCANQQWDTVTVERTFFNGLVTLSSVYALFYSPWTTIYTCREPID